ncbi:MAG: endonuclease/exonuclease/phosphatase family protein [Desertimonas sp.]
MTRRLIQLGPLAGIAVGAVTATSPWWPIRPRSSAAIAQALAPWAALTGWPLAAAALVERQRTAALAGVTLGVAGVGLRRWVRGGHAAGTVTGTGGVRVAHFNVWYLNSRPGAAGEVLAAVDADILILSEITPSLRRCFIAAGLDERYPFSVDRSRHDPGGMAVWSRHPISELGHRRIRHERIRVRLEHPDGMVLVDAIHTQSPVADPWHWATDLAALAREPAPTEPTVLVGDFNAAWTHPGFRAIAERGWRDAHRTLGRGTDNSWRFDRRHHPRFVRLDHALVNGSVDVDDVVDVDLPGSDHRGFVVTVTRRDP